MIWPGRAKNKLNAHAVVEAEKHSDNKRREIKKRAREKEETLLPDGLRFFLLLVPFYSATVSFCFASESSSSRLDRPCAK